VDQSYWRIDEGGLPGCPVGTVIAIVQEGSSVRIMRDGAEVGTLHANTTQQTSTPDGSTITLVNETEGWRAVLSRTAASPAATWTQTTQLPGAEPISPCPRCQVPQAHSTRYCANCGQPLAAVSGPPRPSTSTPAVRGLSVTTKAFLGLAGIVVAVVLLNAATGRSTPASPGQPPVQPAAAAVTLLNISGDGIKNTAPFTASGDHLTVSYAYDCSAFGGSGNFIVDLNDSSGLVDGVANELGAKGQSSSTRNVHGTSSLSAGRRHVEMPVRAVEVRVPVFGPFGHCRGALSSGYRPAELRLRDRGSCPSGPWPHRCRSSSLGSGPHRHRTAPGHRGGIDAPGARVKAMPWAS
jgi:hypothetical protein